MTSTYFQAGSSTLKYLLMHITDRFTKKELEKYSGEEKLQQLHSIINHNFKLPGKVYQSPEPVQKLNEITSSPGFITFSFVRHPYTR